MDDTTAIRFKRPERFRDKLTELLRSGARQLVAGAVEAGGSPVSDFSFRHGLTRAMTTNPSWPTVRPVEVVPQSWTGG